MSGKIILTVYEPEVAKKLSGVVRITEEAQAILHQLQLETGQSERHLASQMIIQGAPLVEIERK